MVGMEQFFTVAAAEEGLELPLYLPDGGKTEFWLRVRGIDSDKFRIADAQAKRAMVIIAAIDDDEKRTRAIIDAQIKLTATLVMSWNLPEECNLANVEKLFRNAPHLMDMVDRIASQRSLFFSKESKGSASGLKQSSSSTKSPQGRKARPETT